MSKKQTTKKTEIKKTLVEMDVDFFEGLIKQI